eukprot:TRINITY_DN15472_c0_g2_i1.p1 TRINITY_DN15472_c0_g2~~TRINITY_DN15472_c0_g2_i1.p1  ORF type:complete len:289 (+),score=23.69 TRINITY_DN15472_c0_g2_i1:492-1358(+)
MTHVCASYGEKYSFVTIFTLAFLLSTSSAAANESAHREGSSESFEEEPTSTWQLSPELTCHVGAWLGTTVAEIFHKNLTMLDCFAELQKNLPSGRFMTFQPGWGCYLTQPGSEQLWRENVNSTACEFHPMYFVPEVTMGRDLSVCHMGGRQCNENPPVSRFGWGCCVRPYFKKCAEKIQEELQECVVNRPARKRSRDAYEAMRAFDILACLAKFRKWNTVIELFTGHGGFTEQLLPLVDKGARIFSIEGSAARVKLVPPSCPCHTEKQRRLVRTYSFQGSGRNRLDAC